MKYIGVAYIIIFIYSHYKKKRSYTYPIETYTSVNNNMLAFYTLAFLSPDILTIIGHIVTSNYSELISYYKAYYKSYFYPYSTFTICYKLAALLFLLSSNQNKNNIAPYIIIPIILFDLVSFFIPSFSLEGLMMNIHERNRINSFFDCGYWVPHIDYTYILLENFYYLILWVLTIWFIKRRKKNTRLELEEHLIE